MMEKSLLTCIARELEEETWYKSKRFTPMLSFYPTVALSTELLHIFTAFDLEEGGLNLDEDEFVKSEIVKFKEVLDMIKGGLVI